MRIKIPILLVMMSIAWISEMQAQAHPDRHTTSQSNSWISCTERANPNTTRGTGHWLMYDFGSTYALQQSTMWNLNTPDYLDAGMRDITIDYSLDGETWIEWGRHQLKQANASSFYEGEAGPDFGGVTARFVLITAYSNYGNACTGFSEFRVAATPVTVSNTKIVELEIELVPSPNPFNNELAVDIKGKLSPDTSYKLVDMSGKVVMSGVITSQRLLLNTANLASGQYNLNLVNSTGTKSVSLAKIN